MKTAIEILQGMRELYTDEARWTRGCYARDEYGNEVGSTDGRATCFCMFGAIEFISGVPVYTGEGVLCEYPEIEKVDTLLKRSIKAIVPDDPDSKLIDIYNDDLAEDINGIRAAIDGAIRLHGAAV